MCPFGTHFFYCYYSFFDISPNTPMITIPRIMIGPEPLETRLNTTECYKSNSYRNYVLNKVVPKFEHTKGNLAFICNFSFEFILLSLQPAKIQSNIPPIARNTLSVSKSKISNAPLSNSVGPTPPIESEQEHKELP